MSANPYNVKFILVINPELINPHSPKKCWQYNFGVVPPPNPISLAMREWGSDVSDLMVLVLASKRCKIHMAQERRYIAQSQWRRCFIVMSIYMCIYILCVYIYISRTASRTQQAQQQQCRTVQQSEPIYTVYIEEIQGTGSSKSRKIWLDTPAFSLLRSYLKNALWEAPKGYPFRWVVPPPNDVHVHLQLKNTLSPPWP